MPIMEDAQPAGFEVHVEPANGTCVVRAQGELDAANVGELNLALMQAEAGGAETILLDIDGLEYIDSKGLKALLDASREARMAERLVMTRGTGHVAKMLEVTGIDQTLPFA